MSAPGNTPAWAPAPGNVVLKKLSDVTPKPILWLWRDYIATGKFHIIAGEPGAGKTTVALSLAAAFSSGAKLPDGSQPTACKVLIWSGEDDIEDTLAPRLMAMGASLDNVAFITATDNRPFNPATDIEALSKTIDEIPGIGLIIIDAIVSAIAGNSNSNGDVRKGLQPLVDLGMKNQIAVIGIHHFTKGTAGNNPVERVSGSLAFGALARMVFVAAKREADVTGGSRMFVRAKSNIAPDRGGFAYDLEQMPSNDGSITASIVKWGDELEGSAKDLLADAEKVVEDKPDSGKIITAKHFLSTKLANGPVASIELEAQAKTANISVYCLRQAKKELGVKGERDGLGPFYCRLPTALPGTWFNASHVSPTTRSR